jgi:hypothetical protein
MRVGSTARPADAGLLAGHEGLHEEPTLRRQEPCGAGQAPALVVLGGEVEQGVEGHQHHRAAAREAEAVGVEVGHVGEHRPDRGAPRVGPEPVQHGR